MKRLVVSMIVAIWLLPACNTNNAIHPTPPAPSPSQEVTLAGENVVIGLKTPANWYLYASDKRIVMSEKAEPITADGTLAGITINIALPDVHPSADSNAMSDILQEILNNGDLQRLVTTPPRTFDWNGYESGYYLVNLGTGNITLVVALYLPSGGQIMTITASTTADDIERLRTTLPTILDSLRVNEEILGSDALAQWPQALNVPEDAIETAIQPSTEP